MYKKYVKQLLDLVLALIAFPFFCILFILIAPLIWIEDRGPIFYNAPRLGKEGKIFKMYKFRSMKVNAPDIRNEDGSTFNSEDDYRLTRIGEFIRKTSIDELPQILNVLIGNMSFIGPRPDLPEAIQNYNEDQSRKLEIKPGITGYSQAFYRNSIDSYTKFKNDVFYVDHISLVLDTKIFIQTIKCILKRENVFLDDKNRMLHNKCRERN
ncbi:MAG: sugar transferase [Clostridiaceae bacterium]